MLKISLTIEDFLKNNGIDKTTLFLLGEGSSGRAYRFTKNNNYFVIKETLSKTEFNFACLLLKEKNIFDNIAKIYNCAKSDKYYYIITEYVDTDDWRIFRYYNELLNSIDDDLGIELNTPEELLNIDLSGFKNPEAYFESEDLKNFILQFLEIMEIYKSYGANDLHVGNLGYSVDGKTLKAFDMDIAGKEQQLIPVTNSFKS